MATTSTRLTEAETALHALAIGKITSYTVNGRAVTYHTLDILQTYVDGLRRQLAAERAGSRRNRVSFGRAR